MGAIALSLYISENHAELKRTDSACMFQCAGNFSILSCNH